MGVDQDRVFETQNRDFNSMDVGGFTSRVMKTIWEGVAELGRSNPGPVDRRVYSRIKCRFKGTLEFNGRKLRVQGSNLDRGGAGVISHEPLPVGAIAFLYAKSYGLMGWATVRWCSTRRRASEYRIGLEFRSSLMRAEVGSWDFSYV